MSLTRRPPTVDPDKIYLTIDTACENTVIGSVYLEKVLQRLGAYGIMPLADKECEQYCFGPGAPKHPGWSLGHLLHQLMEVPQAQTSGQGHIGE